MEQSPGSSTAHVNDKEKEKANKNVNVNKSSSGSRTSQAWSSLKSIVTHGNYSRIDLVPSTILPRDLDKTQFEGKGVSIVHLDRIDDTEYELLMNELKLSSQLRHRNLLPYIKNTIHQDQLWIVTQHCPYASTDQLSKPFGLPELAIALVVRDVLFALDYLHSRGLIHRAVRAAHILVDSSGRCLLSGLKYSIDCIQNGRWLPCVHQYPPNAKENLNWFSPELLEQNLCGYSYKSDIYSLGVTCCELANGIVPFHDMEPTAMLLDKLTGNSPRLLDFTCQELLNLDPSAMSEDDREKFHVFKARHFSNSFHTFTSILCLNFDPRKRPKAAQLLNHSFIKQIKKSSVSSLLDFIESSPQLSKEEKF